MSELTDKVAIVTGSATGIGAGVARQLAADGARVVVADRDTEAGEQVVRGIETAGGDSIMIEADVVSESDCQRLIDTAVEHWGRVDVLVNNAGIQTQVTPLEEMTGKLWDLDFAVNVRGAFLCCRYVIPHMRQQGGGSIVNIGTTAVYRGGLYGLDRLAYICSKGALLTLTKTLARGLLADRIRVNWVTVGWVPTPGAIAVEDMSKDSGLAHLQEAGEAAPLGRLESVEDIAVGVAYLVSEEASHVTGCELNISGGLWI